MQDRNIPGSGGERVRSSSNEQKTSTFEWKLAEGPKGGLVPDLHDTPTKLNVVADALAMLLEVDPAEALKYSWKGPEIMDRGEGQKPWTIAYTTNFHDRGAAIDIRIVQRNIGRESYMGRITLSQVAEEGGHKGITSLEEYLDKSAAGEIFRLIAGQKK